MNLDHLCMGCMEEKGAAGVCPKCGWAEGSALQSYLHMPARTLLQDKYLIGKVLGQGGFGITYLAWDVFLERKLAIKEYFPRDLVFRESGSCSVSIHTGTQSEQYIYGLSKFLAEAKNLARFEGHPNIVSVRDYFEANTTAYMVMNYLEGATLGYFLEHRNSALSCNETLAIINPVLDALRTVHEAGLLHRDVSPDNIMITSSKRVLLLDFGAARHAIGEKGKKFSVIVKPGYAPEEQYRSNGIQGPWTDIYAVAATFYHAATGIMPPESLNRLVEDTLIPPSRLKVDMSHAVESALMKALSVAAASRYQTVVEFQKDLLSSDNHAQTLQNEDLQLISYNTELEKASTRITQFNGINSVSAVEDVSIGHEQALSPVLTSVRIGRAADNDIIINDEMVSRHHAAIYFKDGKRYISDLGSTHGTFVNSNEVKNDLELSNDSTIILNRVKLFYSNNLILSEQGQVLYNFQKQSDRAELNRAKLLAGLFLFLGLLVLAFILINLL
jgi:serine/threonine protein kinase